MGSWKQIRKDSPSPPPPAPVAKTDTGRPISMFEVEPATVTVLGDNEFLPPAYRGLEVYHPTPNWDLAGRALMEFAPPPVLLPLAPLDVAGLGHLCFRCGCPLFWEPIGDPDARCCVQCDPPSPKLVENLWLSENESRQVCVSASSRWKRAAFQEFERRRATAIDKTVVNLQGF